MNYQFKIQIRDIQKPPVWRRLLVPNFITFHQFHSIIQTAFGWGNYHLYQFSPQGWGSKPIYKIRDEYDDNTVKDSRSGKISKIFTNPGQTFTYIYDFGDSWIHHIILEKIDEPTITTSKCTGGKGVCPPEDCGGPWGIFKFNRSFSRSKAS